MFAEKRYPQESLSFIPPSSPMLNQTASKVTEKELGSNEFQKFLNVMFRFAKGEQGDGSKTVLVGCAAPQVGVMKRVILVDTEANGKGQVGKIKEYVNPEIIETSEEEEEWYEGCFSTGRVTGIVSRPKFVTVKALDREGHEKIEKHSGYVARIFQHEIDHLNGRRFPSRVTRAGDLHFVEQDEFPQYRNQQGWRTWEKKCSWAEWEKISKG